MKASNIVLLVFALIFHSCVPKDSVELRDIRNLVVQRGDGDNPVLSGDAVFYNPNAARMKLKEINVDILVDGKKSATVNQKLKTVAKGKSEFIVPLKVQLSLKEIGLMDALKGLFGGKKYEIHYIGSLKVNVNAIPVKIPIDHKEEFKLKF